MRLLRPETENGNDVAVSSPAPPLIPSRSAGIQTKLTVTTPGDAYEQEADRVAEQVMRMPGAAISPEPPASAGGLQRACDCGGSCENCKNKTQAEQHGLVQMKQDGPAAPEGTEAPPIVHEILSSDGQPLDHETRAFMEPRFGQDFSHVRVHTGSRAAESASAVQAKAYTVGQDVVFGAGEYAPGTETGKKLLGHELAHTVQQGHSRKPGLQRQPRPPAPDKPPKDKPVVPANLLTSPDLSKMSRADLIKRYDELNKWYAVKGLSQDENKKLKAGIGDVGGELARRAREGGRTFAVEDVQKMKKYFTDTVKKRQEVTDKEGEDAAEKKFQCINVLRKGMTELFGDDKGLTMTTHNTMEETMGQLQKEGRAGSEHVIKFVSKTNRPIGAGSGARPERPETSIWDYLMSEVKGDIGESVFGLSLMDGWHSVTLTVDNRNPKNPVVRFTDHTLHHDDGWEAMQRDDTRKISETDGYPFVKGSRRSLDEYITYFVQVNWDSQPENKKSTSWIRLWRLKSQPPKKSAAPTNAGR